MKDFLENELVIEPNNEAEITETIENNNTEEEEKVTYRIFENCGEIRYANENEVIYSRSQLPIKEDPVEGVDYMTEQCECFQVTQPHLKYVGEEVEIIDKELPVVYNVDGVDFDKILILKNYYTLMLCDIYGEDTSKFLEIGELGMCGNYRGYSQLLKSTDSITIITSDELVLDIMNEYSESDNRLTIINGDIADTIQGLDEETKFTYIFINKEYGSFEYFDNIISNILVYTTEKTRIKILNYDNDVYESIKEKYGEQISFVENTLETMVHKQLEEHELDNLKYKYYLEAIEEYKDILDTKNKEAMDEYNTKWAEGRKDINKWIEENHSVSEQKATAAYEDYRQPLIEEVRAQYDAEVENANGDEELLKQALEKCEEKEHEIERDARIKYNEIMSEDFFSILDSMHQKFNEEVGSKITEEYTTRIEQNKEEARIFYENYVEEHMKEQTVNTK